MECFKHGYSNVDVEHQTGRPDEVFIPGLQQHVENDKA